MFNEKYGTALRFFISLKRQPRFSLALECFLNWTPLMATHFSIAKRDPAFLLGSVALYAECLESLSFIFS